MKKLLSIVLILVLGMSYSLVAEEDADKDNDNVEIKWVYEYEKALTAAKDSEKPIMIDFYTDWCGWCKKLDETTYKNEEVVAFSENFVNLKLNATKYSKIAKKYGVRGYPTIIFIDKDEKELGRVVGYREAADFLTEMKKYKPSDEKKSDEKSDEDKSDSDSNDSQKVDNSDK